MRKLRTLAFAIPLATVAVLSFAGTASATFITSTCSGGQWQVGLPDLPWADGMTATFDFHLDRVGDELYATRGQTVTAPADATFVFATYSNTPEQSAAYRPQGCVAVAAAPTTTVATSSVPVVTLAPPAPPVVAVAEPPVPVVAPPAAQGVPAASSQTLPATGAGDNLLTLGAATVLTAGLVLVLVARRRVA